MRVWRGMRGFTLVELMVSLVIISVVLLALAGLLINNIRNNQGSEERMDAAAVSQAILAEYSANLISGAWTPGGAPVTGTRKGYNFVLTATQNGSQTVLSVSLQPSAGGRMRPYVNQTVVTTVAGINAGATSGGATSGGATSGGATSGGATSGGATSGGSGGMTPTAWPDIGGAVLWTMDSNFQKGVKDKKGDVKDYNKSALASKFGTVNIPLTLADIVAIQNAIAYLNGAGASMITDNGAWKDAQALYADAVKKWGKAKYKDAGKKFAKMLKALAKAVK